MENKNFDLLDKVKYLGCDVEPYVYEAVLARLAKRSATLGIDVTGLTPVVADIIKNKSPEIMELVDQNFIPLSHRQQVVKAVWDAVRSYPIWI